MQQLSSIVMMILMFPMCSHLRSFKNLEIDFQKSLKELLCLEGEVSVWFGWGSIVVVKEEWQLNKF